MFVTSLAVSPIVEVFPYNPEEAQIPAGFVPVAEAEQKKNPIFTDGINPFEEEEESPASVEESDSSTEEETEE